MPPTVMPVAFDHHREALGVGESRPRISWKTAGAPGWTQTAYQIQTIRNGDAVLSNRIASGESVLVPWAGEPLRSGEEASVRVRVWGTADAGGADGDSEPADSEPSDWSEPATVEAGLLESKDWFAQPISPAWDENSDSDRRPPLLRREFSVTSPIAKARLYVTAHGLYEMELNGTRVGTDILSPGWTVYGERLRYYTYDVTGLVREGDNAVGSWLADGWYRGRIGFHDGYRNLYGDKVALLAQLQVTHVDGTVTMIGTDTEWKAGFGPIGFTGLYEGETYDARRLSSGWSESGFDDGGWSPVITVARDPATLVAPDGPPVRCTEEVRPARVFTSPAGKTLVDFGQNLVGRLRITVQGTPGDTVTLRHAEVLQDGELFTRPLRRAISTDTYTLAGTEQETWEPRFTIHGFRYAEIDGWTGGDISENLVARVYHTDMERTGWFDSSNADLNRLHENVRWSMRGNFVDIPTDCPQRDERLGWTGDIQVFAPTASFLYDCSGMLNSWLKDVAVEQLPDGTIPWYVPVIPGGTEWTPIRPGAVWGDVAVLTPWTIYQRFGDTQVLREQYASAKAWVDLMDNRAGGTHLWNTGFQLGDWLDPTAPPHDPTAAKTDPYLVATAYFAWSATHLGRIASVLGKTADELHYTELGLAVARAFADEYIFPTGTVAGDAQTAYALAIAFDLFPTAEQKRLAGRRLAELVADGGNRIATGFAGTPVISDALTDVGALDTAYDLLLEKECPSWLYAVEQGGTTIWERWDAMQPDGTVNPGNMTSFNHYAFGAVADWMHRVVAGLSPLEPGYRKILFKPRPGGGLTKASARHETPYGSASISWTLGADGLNVQIDVPTGCTARVELPGKTPLDVASGTFSYAVEPVS